MNVVVNDPAPGTASASATATAQVAAAPITATGYTFSAVEGQQYAGEVAFFTSANPSAITGSFTAMILWGDGASSTGVISAAAGTFHVSGSHTYAAMSSGFAAKVLISEQGGGTATAECLALVADAPLSATATAFSGYEDTALVDVKTAGFIDQGTPLPPSAYSATIDWGDGTTTTGTVAADGAGFKILGTHVYGDEGNYSFTVSVAEAGGSNATVHAAASILEALLWNGTRGTPADRWLNEVYGDFLGRLADPGALSYWNSQLSQGVNRNAVVSAIEASGEYRGREVQALFERYLHRSVDPGGQAYFVAQLAAGATVENVAASLIGSSEYLMNRGGGANDDFLNALYQDVLQRPADSGASVFRPAAFKRRLAQPDRQRPAQQRRIPPTADWRLLSATAQSPDQQRQHRFLARLHEARRSRRASRRRHRRFRRVFQSDGALGDACAIGIRGAFALPSRLRSSYTVYIKPAPISRPMPWVAFCQPPFSRGGVHCAAELVLTLIAHFVGG